MNWITRRGALSLAALLLVAGCSSTNQAAVEEMNQQQAQMTQEQGEWSTAIDGWTAEHAQMKQWHQEHPAPASTAEDLQSHMEKMTKHEQDVEQFKADLVAFQAKMSEQANKADDAKVTDHAALWTEHMKHKVTFAALESGHKGLMEEHAEYVGKAAKPS